MRKSNLRAGFTLIEALVVVSVIVLLVALIIPAVLSSRSSARKLDCSIKLRQLGIALSTYNASVNSLPPLINGRKGFSVHSMILPYLEQQSLYQAINFQVPFMDESNETAALTRVASFLCPQDSGVDLQPGTNNYFCNVGYGYQIYTRFNGMFVKSTDDLTSLANVSDGTTYTVLMSESVLGSQNNRENDRLGSVYRTSKGLLKPEQFEAFVQDCLDESQKPSGSSSSSKRGEWIHGSHGNTAYNHDISINGPSCKNGNRYHEGAWTAGSRHGGGANVLFADGHSQFVKDSLSIAAWRSISTRAGGESLDISW